MRKKYYVLVFMLIFGAISLFSTEGAIAEGKYAVQGSFVEGCSCDIPCPCELINFEMGCQTIAAMVLHKGEYEGTNLKNVKIAYATQPGKWVRIYVDAKGDRQKHAAIEFAQDICSGYGKIENTSNAKIEFSEENASFNVKVDDGKVMFLKTEPVIGGDKKTPIAHTNIKSKLTSSFMQGRVITGSFSDGERVFELKDSNS